MTVMLLDWSGEDSSSRGKRERNRRGAPLGDRDGYGRGAERFVPRFHRVSSRGNAVDDDAHDLGLRRFELAFDVAAVVALFELSHDGVVFEGRQLAGFGVHEVHALLVLVGELRGFWPRPETGLLVFRCQAYLLCSAAKFNYL